MEYFVEGIRSIAALDEMNLINLTLKSLSPLFFSIFDEKLSHPWIQIKKKKQLKFLRLSMGFDHKKIKI